MNYTKSTECYVKLVGEFQLRHLGALLGFVVFNLNMFIIVTILRTKTLHTNTNIFIVSVALLDTFLALSDFMHGIFDSTGLIYNTQATKMIDTVLLGVSYGAVTLSCTHMAIIAVDRYITIAHPFYYILHITKRRIMAVLLGAWLFGLIFSSVPLIFYRDEKYHVVCITLRPPSEYFVINALLNLIDYVIIFTCYFKIAHLAFKHKTAANARRLQIQNPNVVTVRTNRTSAMKSVKFFVCMFGCFFICTFPPTLITGMVELSYNMPDNILLSISYLYDIHPLMNFFIYFHLNTEFANGVKKLLLDMKTRCQLCGPAR